MEKTIVCPTCGTEIKVSEEKNNAAKKLMAMAVGNPEMGALVGVIIGKIETAGYVDVRGIVRRWLPSRCLEMVNSEEGFHQALKYRGYDYTWKVLADDLKKQMKLAQEKDMEGVADRNRWYNKELAVKMAGHYADCLKYYIKHEDKFFCRGEQYTKVKCTWLNGNLGVFISELDKLFIPLEKRYNGIKLANTTKELYEAVINFISLIDKISFRPSEQSPAFMNAYKAAGAYYTMKDLILFEGCLIPSTEGGSLDQENSLIALEDIVTEHQMVGGILNNGYKMLGILKDFLLVNKFDLNKAKENWTKQASERKNERLKATMNGGSRYTKK